MLSFFQMAKGNIDVPVGGVLYPQIDVCPGECTKRMGDVMVKSIIFHMHAWGRMIAIRHIRDGKELEPLALVENFAQGFTEKPIPLKRELKGGDSIILEC